MKYYCDYLFASYLGIPQEERKEPLASKMFEASLYKPTIGSDENSGYVRYSTDYNRNKIVDIYNYLAISNYEHQNNNKLLEEVLSN